MSCTFWAWFLDKTNSKGETWSYVQALLSQDLDVQKKFASPDPFCLMDYMISCGAHSMLLDQLEDAVDTWYAEEDDFSVSVVQYRLFHMYFRRWKSIRETYTHGSC